MLTTECTERPENGAENRNSGWNRRYTQMDTDAEEVLLRDPGKGDEALRGTRGMEGFCTSQEFPRSRRLPPPYA